MKKKNHIKVRFSTILLCIPAILLCTTAYGAPHSLDYTVDVDDVLNVGTGTDKDVERIEGDYLMVMNGGTVNLYPGAYVDYGIYVFSGSTVNIYAGELGTGYYIWFLISSGESNADVTVYGTNFHIDDVPLDLSATQFTVDPWNGGVLTGIYENGDPINLKFFSFNGKSINIVTLGTTNVEIDIKPGGNPNNINLHSKGVVPVSVLTTNDFDASTIDPETVLFAGAEPVRYTLCDVDDDSDDDMLFHFRTQELFENDLDEDSTEATLTGETNSGEVISGTDKVWIVPRKNK